MKLPAVVVLGSTGMLGHRLVRTLGELGYLVDGVDREQLAVDRDSHWLEALLRCRVPEVVVNCVGWVRQRAFVDGPAEAIAVNAVFPHQLAAVCRRLGVGLVHISTDCVGDRDWYGLSKALGESIGYGIVLRTSFIGHELDGRPKLGLLEWFLRQAGTVRGYAGVQWNGLTTNELAGVIGRLVLPVLDSLQRYEERVWNVCGPDTTKHRLLELVNEAYGCGKRIVPIDEPVADRRLDGEPFADQFGYEAPAWPAMLEAMRDLPRLPALRAQEVVP